MDKVLVWGIGSWFDRHIFNIIEREQALGEFIIIAYISNNSKYKNFNNTPIIKPEEINESDFDYIIIASTFYKEIREEAIVRLKLSGDKIVDGKVFERPCFNWMRYIRIKKAKPSLIAESCYAGYLYKYLDLQFYSPFIKTRIEQYDYLKLLDNLDLYLSSQITLDKNYYTGLNINKKNNNISWGLFGYPIFKLYNISLHAIHTIDTTEYVESWNRRLSRFNNQNIIAMMIIENDDIADRFSALPISNKIGFYFKKTSYSNIICLEDYNNDNMRCKYNYDFRRYVHDIINTNSLVSPVDFFKLISGDKDFYRFS